MNESQDPSEFHDADASFEKLVGKPKIKVLNRLNSKLEQKAIKTKFGKNLFEVFLSHHVVLQILSISDEGDKMSEKSSLGMWAKTILL